MIVKESKASVLVVGQVIVAVLLEVVVSERRVFVDLL